jgi:uncharacterized oxidoreductase
MKLTGRTILISGGSAGIGLAFALKFLELGNEVIVTGRRQAALDAVKARHPKLHAIQSDVADPGQIEALAARIDTEFPKLDVLFNNAGLAIAKNLRVAESDLAGLMTEVEINVGGSPSCPCPPCRSTAPPKQRFIPTPSPFASSSRKPGWRLSRSCPRR